MILEVELEAVDNELYDYEERTVSTASFVDLYERELVPDHDYRMMYAHLSTSPGSLLDEAIVYTYRRVDDANDPIPRCGRPRTPASVGSC